MEYKGYTYEIENDDMADDPRDFDNLGKMVLAHKRYGFANEIDFDFGAYHSWNEVEGALIDMGYRIQPVYMYDHSGLSFSMGGYGVGWYHAQWDAGQIGYIVVKDADIRKWFGVKRITDAVLSKAIDVLDSEVKEYGAYCNGDVCRWFLYDQDGELIDSCGGYYDCDGCVSDVEAEIDHLVRNKEEKDWERINKAEVIE